MTLLEVGVIIFVLTVFSLLFIPWFNDARFKSKNIHCVSYLKQINLSFKIWASEQVAIFPMGRSVTNGGSMEMVSTGNVVQTFLVMSNELSTPWILCCPVDAARMPTKQFAGLSNLNVSYFVSADATDDSNPRAILSGDSYFEISGSPIKPGLNSFGTNDSVLWSPTKGDKSAGNFALGDGSVEVVKDDDLKKYFQQTSLATNRLAIP